MKNSHHDSDNIRHHVGPFLTWVAERRSGRRALLHTSRRKRKGLAPLAVEAVAITEGRVVVRGAVHDLFSGELHPVEDARKELDS